MTTFSRFALGIGAGIAALGLTAGIYAASQDPNTNGGPGSFRGRRGGPAMGRMMGPAGPFGLGMILSRLELSEVQREQVKGITQAHGDEWKSLSDRIRAARQALDEAVASDVVDESLIRQRSAEVAAVEADMAVASARVRAEIFQLLTPEQQAKAREVQSKRAGRGRQ